MLSSPSAMLLSGLVQISDSLSILMTDARGEEYLESLVMVSVFILYDFMRIQKCEAIRHT